MIFCWHLSVIQFARVTSISGVIIEQGKLPQQKVLKGINNAIQTSKTYFKNPFSNQSIHLKIGDHSLRTKTDIHGSFSAEFKGVRKDTVEIFTQDGKSIAINQSYPILFENKKTEQIVISDIDDTIMRSFTRTKFKRLVTTLFRSAHKRKVIFSTKNLYESFNENNSSFYYVSKSEINLIHIISNFILHNKLPLGPLFLTPYLNIYQLLNSKKDASFKYESICYILDRNDIKPVILIGDDTQADMNVYTDIVKKYGPQIKSVHIRQTSKKKSNKQERLWNELIKTGVEASYFRYDNQPLKQ